MTMAQSFFSYFVQTSTCHLQKRNLPGCRSNVYFCSFWSTAAFHHYFRFPSRCWRWWCYSTAYTKTPSEKLGLTGAHCFSASYFDQSRSKYHRCLRSWEEKGINVLKGCGSIWKRGCLEDSGPQHRNCIWVGDRRNKWLGSTLKSISEETPYVSTALDVCRAPHATTAGYISNMLNVNKWWSALRLSALSAR